MFYLDYILEIRKCPFCNLKMVKPLKNKKGKAKCDGCGFEFTIESYKEYLQRIELVYETQK